MTREHPGKTAKAAAMPPAVTARAHAALSLSLALALSLSGCTGDGGVPAPGSTGATANRATATPTPGSGTPATRSSGTSGPATSSAAPTPLRAPEVRSRIEELQIPWSTVFLPDGTAVISERDSALLRSVRDGKVSTIGAVPGVVPGGEGGLLGLALSPGFASTAISMPTSPRPMTTGLPACAWKAAGELAVRTSAWVSRR